jgi:AhpD family alkylhydroperoxidase
MSHRVEYTKASPAGYKAFGGVHVYLQNCGLPKELIDLVYLRVSQINGCAYCIDMHSRDLLKLGVTVDKLVLVPVWHEARRARLGGNRHTRSRNRRSRC